MKRFRTDNTEGYSRADLDALNAAFEGVLSRHRGGKDEDDIAYKSWLDHVAEELLDRYDSGARGAELELDL